MIEGKPSQPCILNKRILNINLFLNTLLIIGWHQLNLKNDEKISKKVASSNNHNISTENGDIDYKNNMKNFGSISALVLNPQF